MFFDAWLSNPASQTVALPLLVALAIAAVLRVAGGRRFGPALAGAGIGAGFLAGYMTVLGTPHWPPLAALHKLPYLAAAGVVAGIVLDLGRAGAATRRVAVLIATFATAAWIAWPAVMAGDGGAIARSCVLWVLSAGVLVSLDRAPGQAAGPGAMLCAAALGVAILVVLSGASAAALLCIAFAAACLAFFALAWAPVGLAFSASGQLGAGVPLLGLVAGLIHSGDVELSGLPMLLAVFLAGRLSGALLPSRAGFEGALRPLLTFAVALVPVLAAAGLHRMIHEPLFWF